MRYFFANIKAQGASEFEANLEQSLASKAKFLAFICTMPNPPSSFGRVTLFQFTRCIFLCSGEEPYKKSLMILSIELQTLEGKDIYCIKYSGIEVAADLISTNLPAGDRSLDF